MDLAKERRPTPQFPPFAEELAGTLSVHAQYVLHGNFRDLHLVRDRDRDHPLHLLEVLWNRLRPLGYQALLSLDQIRGIQVMQTDPSARDAVLTLLETPKSSDFPGAGADQLRRTADRLRAILSGWKEERKRGHDGRELPPLRVALVIDHASRLVGDVNRLNPDERDFFLSCLQLAYEADPVTLPGRPGTGSSWTSLFNPLIWLADGERDLPNWLLAGSERIRTVAVPAPDADERQRMARELLREYGAQSPRALPVQDPEEAVGAFARSASGMSLTAMRESLHLALDRRIPFDRMTDAVRVYRLGVEKNPWGRDEIRQRILQGEDTGNERSIPRRVLGQEAAVAMTLDILKRAALGLSGAQATSPGHRPRGVLFFAGPTGTGKTELAKAVASVLFDSDQAYLRFDMSEFSAAHSADRLVGAPPGYVGYEAGGELTKAVRENPFRVILFDEIEKADKGVLDKFLQVLEDGRLTDGQGVTTYFSECVLIFTSNLGVQQVDARTQEWKPLVTPGDPYPELERKVRRNIKEHFERVVGRPELMNRLGGNVVVFDFISPDVAEKIFDLQVGNIRRQLTAGHGITLHLTDGARATLLGHCTQDPWKGGRGIGMVLETHLINPLARALFAAPDLRPGAEALVSDVTQDDAGRVEIAVDFRAGTRTTGTRETVTAHGGGSGAGSPGR
ncbi:AAA family ATPase [Streptomyces sp. NPDC005794]|uniref:AAA family ATPase n=1 Tax=Streptomyces sp. NPDC005794 TaxID=3364733 RepID=UPI0036CCF917